MDLSSPEAFKNVVGAGVVLLVIHLLKNIGAFIKMILDWAKDYKVRRDGGNDDGEDGNYSSKILVNREDFKAVLDGIEAVGLGLKRLLEHSEGTRAALQDATRVMHRAEKTIDRAIDRFDS